MRDTKNCLVGHARSGMLSKCWASSGVVPAPGHLFVVVPAKSISCLFDLGIDWPVRPLMQVDKAVTHQLSLAFTHNLHKSLSTCGMVPPTSGWGWVGLQVFADHSAYHHQVTNPTVFEHFLCPLLETHYGQV